MLCPYLRKGVNQPHSTKASSPFYATVAGNRTRSASITVVPSGIVISPARTEAQVRRKRSASHRHAFRFPPELFFTLRTSFALSQMILYVPRLEPACPVFFVFRILKSLQFILSWATGEVNKWTAPGAIRVLKSSVYDVFLLSRGEGEHAERDHLTRQSGLSPAERGNDHQRIPEPNPVAKEAKMRYNEFTDLMLNPDES